MKTLMVGLVLVAGGTAHAQLENFTGGVNMGGWFFGGPEETIESSGGNPNWYLRSTGLDTTIPWLRSQSGSVFGGNYRAANVLAASVDINVFTTDFNIGPFPLSIILRSENGTPGNSEDDWAVYKKGDSIPAPGSGWKRVTFDVPSSATSLPAGWGFIQFGPASPPAPDWNALITNVATLEFSFGDPDLFYIFQMWTVGADNITLLQTQGQACYANCDGSTGTPRLTANDFQCFINKYAANNTYANCDGSTGTPALTANDFQCFINKYAAGCS